MSNIRKTGAKKNACYELTLVKNVDAKRRAERRRKKGIPRILWIYLLARIQLFEQCKFNFLKVFLVSGNFGYDKLRHCSFGEKYDWIPKCWDCYNNSIIVLRFESKHQIKIHICFPILIHFHLSTGCSVSFNYSL